MTDTTLPEGGCAAIYDSESALDAYLEDVRARRQSRALERERARLERSVAKIAREVQAAEADGDAEISVELERHLAEFRRRIAEIECGSHRVHSHAGQESPAGELHGQPLTVAVELDQAEPSGNGTGARPVLPEQLSAPADCHSGAMEAVDSAIHLEEREARAREELRGALESVWLDWPDLEAGLKGQVGNEASRVIGFQVRALASRIQEIAARASSLQTPEPIVEMCAERIDVLDFARRANGDQWQCSAMEGPLQGQDDGGIECTQWVALAARYTDAAEAEAGLEELNAHGDLVPSGPRQDLLNAIAARQQRLYRLLRLLSLDDMLQSRFRAEIKEAAQSWDCYLCALHTQIGDTKLQAYAESLPKCLEAARLEAQRVADLRRKEHRSDKAIRAVVEWAKRVESQPPACAEEAAAALLPLLDECREAQVPATRLEVREAVIRHGIPALNDRPEYKQFWRAATVEAQRRYAETQPGRKRCDGGAEKPEEPEAVTSWEQAEVSALLDGLRLLIIGGVPRPRTRTELKERLGCADVRWSRSEKGDRASKFERAMQKADVLIVVKNYISHEIAERARDLSRMSSLQLVVLPSGYGVDQIIHQIREQLCKPAVQA